MPTSRQPEPAQPLAPTAPEPRQTAGIVGAMPSAFRSVLFADASAPADIDARERPAPFGDLNLDQVVDAVAASRRAYNLTPFFHEPLTELDTIRFRQEIFIDLEGPDVYAAAEWFGKQELAFGYARQRKALGDDHGGFAHYHYMRSFLNAVVHYCQTLERFNEQLDSCAPRSRGLLGLGSYLNDYLGSESFRTLREEARTLDSELDEVRYSLLLKGSRVTVGPYSEQDDYSAHVSATFERFAQNPLDADEEKPRDWDTYTGLGILHLVAKVYPELFARLDAFCAQHIDYLDATVAAFDRELQFFMAYLDYIRPLRESGLTFSYPVMSADDRSEQALETFDLALAAQRVAHGDGVVCNDLRLDEGEQILVITGPNNGGKTTFARTIGQLHYLSRLGCPVPGQETRLFLCDQIFTRFERREDSTTLEGKLQDELDRLHDAFTQATPSSLFILNEMFSSTTAYDALLLSREILRRIAELDCLCVCVTFLDELARFSPQTLSMVSEIDPADPSVRTYRLTRRAADGRAYARALAEKYGLTYAQLMRRGRS